MRILLAAEDEPATSRLAWLLERAGHEVIRATSRGAELLSSIELAGQLHAAVLAQTSLGRTWPRLLRQLRRHAPDLPVVLLLGPRADRAWRLAILIGAFEALPASIPEGGVLRAVQRALRYAAGKSAAEPSTWPEAGEVMGRPAPPVLARSPVAAVKSG